VGFLLLSKENVLDLVVGKGKIYLIEGRVFVKKILAYHRFENHFQLGTLLKKKILSRGLVSFRLIPHILCGDIPKRTLRSIMDNREKQLE